MTTANDGNQSARDEALKAEDSGAGARGREAIMPPAVVSRQESSDIYSITEAAIGYLGDNPSGLIGSRALTAPVTAVGDARTKGDIAAGAVLSKAPNGDAPADLEEIPLSASLRFRDKYSEVMRDYRMGQLIGEGNEVVKDLDVAKAIATVPARRLEAEPEA